MHYLFETEAKFRVFMENVSRRLVPGGYFIATTVDAERVVSLIREQDEKNGKLCISNKFFSIQLG